MINNTKNAASFTSIADFIGDIETKRTRALVERDMTLLWQLHAPDYQLITPPGRTYSRERYLGEIESGTLRYLRWDHGAMSVRVSERMAIVCYQATLELDAGDGHGTPFACWHTDSSSWRTTCGALFGRRQLRLNNQRPNFRAAIEHFLLVTPRQC